MAREVDIDYAISETLKQHPDFVPYLSNIIYKNIYSGTNPVNFTSRVREEISTAKQVDFVNYILQEAITIYSAAGILAEDLEDTTDKENMNKHFPMFSHIKRAVEILKDKTNNAIIYYLYNRTELFELIEAICQTIYKKQWYLPNTIEKDTRNAFHRQLIQLAEKDPSSKTLKRMLNKETKIVSGIRNLEINYEAINICQREIMLGNQVRNAHNSYALGDCLFASQDIGKKRRNQEDSVLILEHEENPKFKIMAVADGMGGLHCGEVASSYIVSRLAEWFNMLSADFYDYPEQLQIVFANELLKISKEIYNKLGSSKKELVGGSTFTGAILTKDKTIICSVGDSRAYTVNGFDVNLVTEDESQVWDRLKKSKNREPITQDDIDDLRFAEGNNVITRCMGDKNLDYIQTHTINNQDYEMLLLFSDGITDILSTDDIKLISATTAPKDIAEVFVHHAITHGVTEKLNGVDYEVELISAGKDNASAVALIRR
ncbi:MAG: serine/threonine-protein phosphatase [Bacilli bacterium]|nr:serine/threonine-protein phosphatase [Bacilli bacterium]